MKTQYSNEGFTEKGMETFWILCFSFCFVYNIPKSLIFHKSIIFDIKCMIFCITDMIFGKEKV